MAVDAQAAEGQLAGGQAQADGAIRKPTQGSRGRGPRWVHLEQAPQLDAHGARPRHGGKGHWRR